jgi:hypothetical protein
VASSGKIALVTLVRSPHADFLEANELVDEIRRNLALPKLSKQWKVEKITILDEFPPTTKAVARRRERLLIP